MSRDKVNPIKMLICFTFVFISLDRVRRKMLQFLLTFFDSNINDNIEINFSPFPIGARGGGKRIRHMTLRVGRHIIMVCHEGGQF